MLRGTVAGPFEPPPWPPQEIDMRLGSPGAIPEELAAQLELVPGGVAGVEAWLAVEAPHLTVEGCTRAAAAA